MFDRGQHVPSLDDLQRSLENAIAHVVGQGVVALALGCEIHFVVEKHSSGEFFDGHCLVRRSSGEIPSQILRPIGVAGPIAVAALLSGSADDLNSCDIFAELESGKIKIELPGINASEFTLSDVDFAVSVLQTHWPIVTREVECMTPNILNGTNRLH